MTIQRTLGALVLGMCVSSVNAGVVTVSQSMSLDRYLSGSSQSFGFDLNGSLAALGVTGANVMAGSLTVTGYSGLDFHTLTMGYVGPYLLSTEERDIKSPFTYLAKCGKSLCKKTGYSTSTVTDTHYGKDITVDFKDKVQDSMVVSAGASSASDTADQFSSSSDATNYARFLTLGSYQHGYTTFDARKVITESGYSGSLFTELGLDTAALADIHDDGLFSFIVNAPGLSQFTLKEARIDLLAMLEDPLPEGEVPEPATFGLLGGALGMLALARRRQRKG